MSSLAYAADAPMASPVRVDGRNLRAESTRAKVVAGCRALMAETGRLPKVAEIAVRAGVSVRSVFQHFQDVETLFATVLDEAIAELHGTLPPARAEEGPLAERVARLVAMRAGAFERAMPLRVAAFGMAGGVAPAPERGRALRVLARQRTALVFKPELDALDATVREQTLDALQAAMDWENWIALRHFQRLAVDEAEAVWRRTVTALILQARTK
ncbi:MAG: TetR/AcrR family transcriptional regulator [Rhodospirillales bacterium]|nr:MAG: TetR/AcrR family transcriptional regulator [Rhodospirillales bacterium]